MNGNTSISHETALNNGQTLDQVIGDNPGKDFTQGEADMVNNAITDIVSKTEGLESGGADLHNGKTSVSFYQQGSLDGSSKEVWMQSNNGNNLGDAAVATTDKDNKGKANITYNLKWFSGRDLTVENIQNTWVHEKGNHYNNNVPGGSNEEHAKAIYNQSKHPTWKNTTENFKSNMRSIYQIYTGRPLKR